MTPRVIATVVHIRACRTIRAFLTFFALRRSHTGDTSGLLGRCENRRIVASQVLLLQWETGDTHVERFVSNRPGRTPNAGLSGVGSLNIDSRRRSTYRQRDF